MTKIAFNKHRINTTDHFQLQAYTAGDPQKPAMVFVHGYPDDHQIWLPLMQQLMDDFFIIAYDVRGAGLSDIPKKIAQYKLAQLADDLWSVTNTLLGDEPFYVIGHDWGSIQTWEAACQYRFKNKMLAFISISGPCLDHISHIIADADVKPSKKLKQTLRSWYVYVFHLPIVPKLLWKSWHKKWHQLQDLPEHPHLLHNATTGMNLYKANMFTRLKPRKMHAICPVQLMILTKDTFVTPILFSGIEQWVSNLTCEELPLKHWGMYNHREQVADKIKPFIQSL